MSQSKYYVVWVGHSPGIYDSWAECRRQVQNYPQAKYKGFASQQEAAAAFREGYAAYYAGQRSAVSREPKPSCPDWVLDTLAVECLVPRQSRGDGVPGSVCAHGKGDFPCGSVSRRYQQRGGVPGFGACSGTAEKTQQPDDICSDSRNAIAWVRARQCKTKLARTGRNDVIFDLIARAEKWLRDNDYTNKIVKWETREWGEVPADFGRK